MVYIIAAIIMTIWSLAHLPQPTYLPLPGVIDWNQDASAAIPTAILFFTVLSPSLIFFFYQSIVVKDFPIRARAFLFSLGIALLISSAVFFYLLDFSWKFMIVNFLAMLGYLVFLVGIIIGRQREL